MKNFRRGILPPTSIKTNRCSTSARITRFGKAFQGAEIDAGAEEVQPTVLKRVGNLINLERVLLLADLGVSSLPTRKSLGI